MPSNEGVAPCRFSWQIVLVSQYESLHARFEKLLSAPQLARKARQHHTPSFYLEGFCENGGLTVFHLKTSEIKPQTPKNTGLIGHLYTFMDEQGRKRYEWEEMFAEIEKLAAPLIAKLNKGEPLSPVELDPLITFIAYQAVRTPSAMAGFVREYETQKRQDMRAFCSDENTVARYLREHGHTDEAEVSRLVLQVTKTINDDAYDIEVEKEFVVAELLKRAKPVALAIHPRDYLVLYPKSDTSKFLTTDAPVVLERTGSATTPLAFASPDAVILFPVSKRCALAISGSGKRFGRRFLEHEEVVRFNRTIVTHAHEYVFAPDAATLAEAQSK